MSATRYEISRAKWKELMEAATRLDQRFEPRCRSCKHFLQEAQRRGDSCGCQTFHVCASHMVYCCCLCLLQRRVTEASSTTPRHHGPLTRLHLPQDTNAPRSTKHRCTGKVKCRGCLHNMPMPMLQRSLGNIQVSKRAPTGEIPGLQVCVLYLNPRGGRGYSRVLHPDTPLTLDSVQGERGRFMALPPELVATQPKRTHESCDPHSHPHSHLRRQ